MHKKKYLHIFYIFFHLFYFDRNIFTIFAIQRGTMKIISIIILYIQKQKLNYSG